MAITKDGNAHGIISGAAASSVSASLTTTGSNDVIVAVVVTTDPTASRTVSSIAGTGTTGWTKYTARAMQSTTGAFDNMEIWWGTAAAALSGVSIAVTLSAATQSSSLVVFGVNGANTTTPFDANVSLPASNVNTDNSSGAVPSGTVSTTNTNTLMFGCVGGSAALPSANNVSGFSAMDRVDGFSGASNFYPSYNDVNYQIFSSAQSSITAGFTASQTAWIMEIAAIVAAGAAPTASGTTLSLMGV